VLSSKPILLVEDDNVDAMTVKRAIKDLGSKDTLVRSANGEEALDYLRNETNEKPRLILLDLNMPKMNGIEFLRHIKADDLLKRVPVIVLTTSMEDQDILRSFELSIAGYVVKPLDYKKFVEIIRTISQYWTLSLLPCTG
jgi:CheY-like chemotaxis protein